MERLYTEREWRAIAELETRNDCYLPSPDFEKRLLGPAFTAGEFYIACRSSFQHPKEMGPPRPMYWIYEKTGQFRVTYENEDKTEILAGARKRLTDIPADILARMLSEAREEVAAKEAQEAIERAKQDAKKAKKAKPIGRRRKQIFQKSEGHCHYCNAELELTGEWHIEHKMPKALGGTNEAVNLVASCAPCNRAKKDKTDVEFFAILAAQQSLPRGSTQRAPLPAGRNVGGPFLCSND